MNKDNISAKYIKDLFVSYLKINKEFKEMLSTIWDQGIHLIIEPDNQEDIISNRENISWYGGREIKISKVNDKWIVQERYSKGDRDE